MLLLAFVSSVVVVDDCADDVRDCCDDDGGADDGSEAMTKTTMPMSMRTCDAVAVCVRDAAA